MEVADKAIEKEEPRDISRVIFNAVFHSKESPCSILS